jgi:hypothetical protein
MYAIYALLDTSPVSRFILIPTTTIVLDPDAGTTSTFPSYLKSLRNPDGYPCNFACARYGRQDIWLVRVMNISPQDWASLAAKPDVYVLPPDASLDNVITDKAVIEAFFESFKIPAAWIEAGTTYRELLKAVVNMCRITQRFFGIAGYELFTGGVTLETTFSELSAQSQSALQQTVNELAGEDVPINPSAKMRLLLKVSSTYWEDEPTTLGDYTL